MEHLQVRQAVTPGPVWHVRLHDFTGDTSRASFDRHAYRLAPLKQGRPGAATRPAEQPYIAVDFLIGENHGLEVLAWSISGYQPLATRRSRFPLQTYARAAVLAVEDALAVDDLTYEKIMEQELPYHGHLADDGSGHVYREFKIVDGRIEDPRTGRPRTPARHKHTYPKNGKHQLELGLVVDEYRRAIDRGSRSPTVDVARAFNVGRSTAARSIAAARKQGLLGPALRNRAGEQM